MRLLASLLLFAVAIPVVAQQPASPDDAYIQPSRPVSVGKAPGMKFKLLKSVPDEKVYVIIFKSGDEALSGLTDFALAHHIGDAHFTAIGASSGATVGWFDFAQNAYRRIPVTQQVEVLSLIGDIASFNGKPVVHIHTVLGKSDGSTIGGHVFELNINPTLEVFLTANTTTLKKKPIGSAGLKLIDPSH